MRIAIGSESAVKREAVERAFPGAEVLVVSGFVSAVPAQPVGAEETERGAQHRAHAARERHPDADLCIGIESGMIREAGAWVDRACIVAISGGGGGGKTTVGWSEALAIPDQASIVIAEPPLAEQPVWSQLKDPHVVVTGGKRSRADFIADALRAMGLARPAPIAGRCSEWLESRRRYCHM
jgi:hypothetical protein